MTTTMWGDIAVRVARQLASPEFPGGDFARLRRGHQAPEAAWRLMAQHGIADGTEQEVRWCLVFQGIALMTPRGGGSAHDGAIPVGRALFMGGALRLDTPVYSEMRLSTLLKSRGAMTRSLLVRAFRMLAVAGVTLDWREMAEFILSDGIDDQATERARKGIAREYYKAQAESLDNDFWLW